MTVHIHGISLAMKASLQKAFTDTNQLSKPRIYHLQGQPVSGYRHCAFSVAYTQVQN